MSEPLDLEPIKAREQAATPGPWMDDAVDLRARPRKKDGECKYCGSDMPLVGTYLGWHVHRYQVELYDGSPARVFSAGAREYVITPRAGVMHEDAAFIAHARQDVPALIAEVERLRACIAQVIVDLFMEFAPTKEPADVATE